MGREKLKSVASETLLCKLGIRSLNLYSLISLHMKKKYEICYEKKYEALIHRQQVA